MSKIRIFINWIARSPLRAFIIIFLLGLSFRLFLMTLVSERYILPHSRWENTAIATSLVEHGRFADPYMIPTGATAHLPPLVPGTIALIWSIFGLGLAGGYAHWIFNILANTMLFALLPWLGGKLGPGRQAGVLAGLIGSLIPFWGGNFEELSGLVLALLAVVFLHRWSGGAGSLSGSFLLGAACGISFHLQPVLMPVVMGWIAFELWWRPDRRKWYTVALLLLGAVVACLPWAWRNYTVFHEIFFIRGNLGLELRMANHDGATGAADVMGARRKFRHPRTDPEEARLVRELGEAEYMRRARIEALDWIRNNTGEFLKLTGSRFIQFWFGPLHVPWFALLVTSLTLLALMGAWYSFPVMTLPQRGAFFIPLVFFPLIYYLVMYMPRYRYPLDWMLFLLAGAAVWRWIEGR